MSKQGVNTADDILVTLREELARASAERESQQLLARNRLRDAQYHLREPAESRSTGPGSLAAPAFKLTPSQNYPGAVEHGGNRSSSGHLSPGAETKFLEHMKVASQENNPHKRDAEVGKAAKVAGADWDQKHGHAKAEPGMIGELRRQARAQMMFTARELGEKIGLNPAAASVIGYSLERALEKEGFKVVASHAVDKISDAFRSTAASVSTSTGIRHTLESNLTKSMNYLASHGVTRDAIKDVLRNHSGKLIALTEIASHPEALSRAAAIIGKSDKVVDGVIAAASDSELRKALGSVTLATGEAVASVGARSVGSVAIVAGAMMRGDSAAETSRHIFRAAVSIMAGAAGGIAGGALSMGFGSVAGAVAGAELGSRLADKMIAVYDQMSGKGAEQPSERMVSNDELKRSTEVIGDRAGGAAKDAATKMAEGVKERGIERTREMTHSLPTG